MSEAIGENGFRDFVITTMENTLKFMVIVFTCSGGVFGAMIAFMIEAPRSIYFAQTAASHVWTWTFLGFIIGAVAGFVFSATLAGIAFSLAETAENTRKVALVLGSGGTFGANSAPVVWNNAAARSFERSERQRCADHDRARRRAIGGSASSNRRSQRGRLPGRGGGRQHRLFHFHKRQPDTLSKQSGNSSRREIRP